MKPAKACDAFTFLYDWLPSPRQGTMRLNIRDYFPTAEFLKLENMVKYLPPIQPVTD